MTDHHASLDRALARTRPDEHAAQIVHRILCIRCRMDWHCGGLSEDDFGEAGRIADLLAEVRAEAALWRHQIEGRDRSGLMALDREAFYEDGKRDGAQAVLAAVEAAWSAIPNTRHPGTGGALLAAARAAAEQVTPDA